MIIMIHICYSTHSTLLTGTLQVDIDCLFKLQFQAKCYAKQMGFKFPLENVNRSSIIYSLSRLFHKVETAL